MKIARIFREYADKSNVLGRSRTRLPQTPPKSGRGNPHGPKGHAMIAPGNARVSRTPTPPSPVGARQETGPCASLLSCPDGARRGGRSVTQGGASLALGWHVLAFQARKMERGCPATVCHHICSPRDPRLDTENRPQEVLPPACIVKYAGWGGCPLHFRESATTSQKHEGRTAIESGLRRLSAVLGG